MDKDQYDEQAERLLPCKCEDHHREGSVICPASYRPAVAAALRKQAWINDAVYQGMERQIADLRAKIEQLKEQLPETMQDCTIKFIECENGHGRLTATNWAQGPCHWCEIAEAEKRAELWEGRFKQTVSGLVSELERKNFQMHQATICLTGKITDTDICEWLKKSGDNLRAAMEVKP